MNQMLSAIGIMTLIAGCASSSETYLPDGSAGYSLDCSGTLRDWGACYEKAGELCGTRGYDIIGAQGEGGAAISGAATNNTAAVSGSTLHFRTMQIACK